MINFTHVNRMDFFGLKNYMFLFTRGAGLTVITSGS